MIPNFSYPVSQWAKTTEILLTTTGVSINDPTTTQTILPYILSKLPFNILQVTPKDGVREALQFLETYDEPHQSWSEISGICTQGLRPSLTYAKELANFRSVMRHGDERTMSELAWKKVSSSLPQSLRVLLPLLQMGEAPNQDQLQRLDEAWASTNVSLQQVEIAAVHVPQSSHTAQSTSFSSDNKILQSLEEIKLRLAKLEVNEGTSSNSGGARNFTPRPMQNVNRPSGQNYQHTQNSVGNNQSKNNFCYYHARFGRASHRCIPPCSFKNLN